jgi:hypothetical protein
MLKRNIGMREDCDISRDHGYTEWARFALEGLSSVDVPILSRRFVLRPAPLIRVQLLEAFINGFEGP